MGFLSVVGRWALGVGRWKLEVGSWKFRVGRFAFAYRIVCRLFQRRTAALRPNPQLNPRIRLQYLHDLNSVGPAESWSEMNKLIAAIVEDDAKAVKGLLLADAGLATRLMEKSKLHDSGIFHWIYVGDTALHLAAAGYRVEIVRLLLKAGADPNAAGNKRRSTPLHYAADGFITG